MLASLSERNSQFSKRKLRTHVLVEQRRTDDCKHLAATSDRRMVGREDLPVARSEETRRLDPGCAEEPLPHRRKQAQRLFIHGTFDGCTDSCPNDGAQLSNGGCFEKLSKRQVYLIRSSNLGYDLHRQQRVPTHL